MSNKEELLKRFETEIAQPHDYFNHRGGLVNDTFNFFWSELYRLSEENERHAIKFGTWYSGMEEQKVKTAYERFKKEVDLKERKG